MYALEEGESQRIIQQIMIRFKDNELGCIDKLILANDDKENLHLPECTLKPQFLFLLGIFGIHLHLAMVFELLEDYQIGSYDDNTDYESEFYFSNLISNRADFRVLDQFCKEKEACQCSM